MKFRSQIVLDSDTKYNSIRQNVVQAKLVHGAEISEINEFVPLVENVDGLVTANRNLRLSIKTADCAPICFGDGNKIGIAHAGWRGLHLGLIENMLARFDHDSLDVFVGPHLHMFEIQKDECYDLLASKFGEQFFRYEGEMITFLFKDAIASRLPKNVVFDIRNTGKDLTLPSFRRNKTTERMCTIVQFT